MHAHRMYSESMAKMLQVRNVPEQIHVRLRQRAKAAGLSLSDFALRELERTLSRPPLDEVLSRAAHRGGQLSFTEAVEAIHDERAADR